MVDIANLLSNLPSTYVNGVNVPVSSPQASPDMSGLASVLSAIIPGTTPDVLSSILGGALPPVAMSDMSGNTSAPGPVPAVTPSPSANVPPASPAAPAPNLGIATPLSAHGPAPAMPQGGALLPAIFAQGPDAGSPPTSPYQLGIPAPGMQPPVAPSAPTPQKLTPLAKALMILTGLAGGGREVNAFVQGQQQADQQKFENQNAAYRNQMAAYQQSVEDTANRQTQQLSQLNAHAKLFDTLVGLDPASQEAYVNALSPQQLAAYAINKSSFFDKDGNFVPVQPADTAAAKTALLRAQTAAQKSLGGMLPASQMSLHDSMNPKVWEDTYGVPWQGFTPIQTIKDQNDTLRTGAIVQKAVTYDDWQKAHINYLNALTTGIPEKIEIARQHEVTLEAHLSNFDAEHAQHDRNTEDISQQGLLIRKQEMAGRLGIEESRLNLYRQKVQQGDSVVKPLYTRLSRLDGLIQVEDKAKDAALNNVALDPATQNAQVQAHNLNIQHFQHEAGLLQSQIDQYLQQKNPSAAQKAARRVPAGMSGARPPSVKNPNVPYAQPVPKQYQISPNGLQGFSGPPNASSVLAPVTRPSQGTSIIPGRPLAGLSKNDIYSAVAQRAAQLASQHRGGGQ